MKKTRDYWFGIAISFLLAGLLAFLGGWAVITPDMGWGAAALLAYGVMFGGPLAIVLALTWLVYMVRDRGRLPGRAHALMFIPPLLAAMIVPVHESILTARRDRFRESHPAIAETHVNLSGRTIWLDTRKASGASGVFPTMEPASAEDRRYAQFRRYPGPGSETDDRFPYAGARLKEGVERYVYLDEGERQGRPCRCAASLIPIWGSCRPRMRLARRGCWCISISIMPTMSRWRPASRASRS
ncbi:hypothetical protein WJ976_29010 [Achromobacter denitrificans]